jgi:site-specific recombinase
MGFLSRFRPKSDLNDVLQSFFDENEVWKEKGNSVSILSKLVNAIRPRKWSDDSKPSIKPLLDIIDENPVYKKNIKAYLKTLLQGQRFEKILTDADIIKDVSFFYELKQRIVSKFIPDQPDYNSLEYVLTQVFYVDNDSDWVNAIPKEEIIALLNILFETDELAVQDVSIERQIVFSCQVLMSRITGVATEQEVNKMVPEYADYENPFLALQSELLIFLERIGSEAKSIEKSDIDYRQLNILFNQCNDFINEAYKNTQRFGISIRVNQYLLRMQQQLNRVKLLVDMLIQNKEKNTVEKRVDLSLFLIGINYNKNNIRELFSKSTQRVAFEITQHKAKTGEHYITKDKFEYRKMLNASLGGGAVVGVMCITKLLLSKLSVSPFGTAFLYSLNYAAGFIIIYLLGYTLATKQPAMTASSFVKALQDGEKNMNKKKRYLAFSVLFARLFRSQFIAFVGNVVMAFPVALLGIWVLDLLLDVNIAEEKGEKLLKDINPLMSLALLHAAIAGVWLFLSGVIAGNVSNRIKHNRIPFRIQEHPMLKVLIGRKRAIKIAEFHQKKYPGIVSNLMFGVFMGSTASLGYVLGLNLDVRHITFASGNFALGLYGVDWSTTVNMIVWVVIGIGLIGFLNFIVSFTLSIIVALRSCGISILELRHIIYSVFLYFLEKPLHFFFPLEKDEDIEVLKRA